MRGSAAPFLPTFAARLCNPVDTFMYYLQFFFTILAHFILCEVRG
jgi:hypothetical protein